MNIKFGIDFYFLVQLDFLNAHFAISISACFESSEQSKATPKPVARPSHLNLK